MQRNEIAEWPIGLLKKRRRETQENAGREHPCG
jgi:hypothetical protein